MERPMVRVGTPSFPRAKGSGRAPGRNSSGKRCSLQIPLSTVRQFFSGAIPAKVLKTHIPFLMLTPTRNAMISTRERQLCRMRHFCRSPWGRWDRTSALFANPAGNGDFLRTEHRASRRGASISLICVFNSKETVPRARRPSRKAVPKQTWKARSKRNPRRTKFRRA